jgi:hypothetical protein
MNKILDYANLFARLALIIGGINYMFIMRNSGISNSIFMVVVGLSALFLALDRDFYLPFLGKCVFPTPIITNPKNVQTMTITNLPPNVNVIYWGAKNNNTPFDNPWEAYGDYSNSGITKSDAKGVAEIRLSCPAEYSVNKFGIINKKLKRHVHYRFELPNQYGMYSKVYNKMLNEKCE